MTLNKLKVGEKAIVSYVNTTEDTMDILYPIIRLGVVPGVELKKVSSVATCSEYIMYGINIIIDKCAADYIMVVRS